MFETLISDLEDILEDSKSSIRKVLSSFSEKISNCRESEMHRLVNLVSNAIFPNILSVGTSSMKKVALSTIMNMKEEVKSKVNSTFIGTAKKDIKEWLEEYHSLTQKFNKEKEVLVLKEKAANQKANILYQKFAYLEKSHSWYSFIFGSNMSRVKSVGLSRKLLQTQGGSTFIRLKIRMLTFLILACSQFEDFLKTRISSKLEFLEGKISAIIKIADAELNSTDNNISPDKGYQVDLQMRNKLSDLSERVNSKISDSIATELLGKLEKVSVEEILEILKSKLSKIYEDFKNFSALERIDEIYSNREDLAVFFQSMIEREGSPFIPLNDSLLEKSPLFITTIGIADRSHNRIDSALESRTSRGSNSVGIQNDPEKVISLVTAHRIPSYAIAGFKDYTKAVEIKEQEEEFAVYPERRFYKYLSSFPSLSKVRLENYLALGLAINMIKNYAHSWYKVNGKKIHGLNNLRRVLASDTETLHLIKNKWLEIYNQEGMSGVFEKLNHAKESLVLNGLADVFNVLEKRLSSIKEDEMSQERFSQIIEG